MIECPRHEGSFDCTPFCNICEGQQEYNPEDQLPCVACHDVKINKDIYIEELGFCVECSHEYWAGTIDPYTLVRV